MSIYCEPCPFLNNTEEEQDNLFKKKGVKFDHFCNKFDERLKHFDVHPKLRRLPQCFGYGKYIIEQEYKNAKNKTR
jgi:hypothetical protein